MICHRTAPSRTQDKARALLGIEQIRHSIQAGVAEQEAWSMDLTRETEARFTSSAVAAVSRGSRRVFPPKYRTLRYSSTAWRGGSPADSSFTAGRDVRPR